MTQVLAVSQPFKGLKARAVQARGRAAKLWQSHPRETVGVGLLGMAAITLGIASVSQPEAAHAQTPPAPPPLLIREIPKTQAVAVNQHIPLISGPNPAAAPFKFRGSAEARARAAECLASAVYYEAGQESSDGQRAVAQVVLNRVRHGAFPATVCGVVYQGSTRATGCQFTFTCDGSLYRGADVAGWRRAYKVAEAALAGAVYAPVGWATHYHANYVVPYWAPTLAKNAVVGAHIFYRWAGNWGRPPAFAQAYARNEPNVAALRSAALAAEAATALQPVQRDVAEAIEDIPGAQAMTPLAPSMRGDKRVAVRFNMAAREASAKVEPKAYVEKFEASDNLRWTLSGGAPAADQPGLGRKSEAAPPADSPASAQD
jgi:spore germination cell wall hydrolase CwlJ-like protein